MRNITEYINEARVQSGPVEIEYTPKDRNELITAIKEVAKAQSRRKVLDFNCIDTRLVQNMDSVFYHAFLKMPAQLKKDFLVDQWDVSNVSSFNNLFCFCSGFTGKGLENWKVTSKCKTLFNVFNECTSLEEIDMTRWDLSSVTTVKYMFDSASSLQSVQFPNEMPQLDSMIETFSYCPTLTYVKLPKKLQGAMYLTNKMFYNAGSKYKRLVVDNLDSIVLPKTDGKNVDSSCADMFYSCGIMREILKEYIRTQNLSDDDIKLLAINTDKL